VFAGLYYGITIVIVSLATAMTVLTLNIHHKGEEGVPVPRYIKLVCFGFFARLLCLKLQKPDATDSEIAVRFRKPVIIVTAAGSLATSARTVFVCGLN
jgi:hypothetical protein